jgi:hypothetical protein
MNNGGKKEPKKLARNFLAWLKAYDKFGQPVGLTINGDSEFKTLEGGAASVALGIFLVYIVTISFIPVVTK